jgi:hypothetical protein
MKSTASALAAAVLLSSCGSRLHWSERAAQDRIMLVREMPPTLGHRRLAHQAVAHPDLARFLETKGRPDFIAETSSDDRQYLVLYYLARHHAYACRSWRGQPDAIEFAGPTPITDQEVEVLGKLQSGVSEAADSGMAAGRLQLPQEGR